MTTYLTPMYSQVGGEQIASDVRAYFQQRLENRVHQLLLTAFIDCEKAGRLQRKDLAKRSGKRPETITRVLGAPANHELDTISDILLGMGLELSVGVMHIGETLQAVSGMRMPRQPAPHEETMPAAPPQTEQAAPPQGRGEPTDISRFRADNQVSAA